MQMPQQIRLSRERDCLILVYAAGEYRLNAEYLRVYSPSAQVRGHGKGQEKLQTGKRGVLIDDLQPSGNYALKIVFSDRHDSGLYDWDYLHDLAVRENELWQAYLKRLTAAGASREPSAEPPKPQGKSCGGCGGKH